MHYARCFLKTLLALCLLSVASVPTSAQLNGPVKFIVLRVQFSDMKGTTYTAAELQKWFTTFIPSLWGTDSSYGTMQQNFLVSTVISLPHPTAYYVDAGNDSSTAKGFGYLVSDAVSNAPAGLNWQGAQGVIILFSDTRVNGSYRGITYTGLSLGVSGAPSSVAVSVVSEDPAEDETTAWGRVAHEIGHEMQQAAPPHPSDYQSHFEQMDGEYPAQTGVFEKQPARGFPGWLPPAKYVNISPRTGNGAELAIWAQENPPLGEPDAQAARAYLSFGGATVYYLVSVRRRTLGDDLSTNGALTAPTDCDAVATPQGIPDCGVLIERVVENGDPNIRDCDPQFGCDSRWVHVIGNGSADHLWHLRDTYSSTVYPDNTVSNDGITIGVRLHPDRDHYVVYISYNGIAGKGPDLGLQSWLEPPGNTYESTDIWFDNPVNDYAAPDTNPLNYRYGVWADGLGGVVPMGNGDDPAVGLDNRFYARIRNYGAKPAINATVFFDVTNPPGLGIQGSNGFQNIGQVGPAQFPALANIPPGGFVDVYLDWTPNFPLTQQQIAAGVFSFHTCVRVRVSHVPGETFFANQDGNGQQENIAYFDATGAGGQPGAPGPVNTATIHLKNDSPAVPKTFILGFVRDSLPSGWAVTLNGGRSVVTVPPATSVNVPVSIQQNVAEPVGTVHTVSVIASSKLTFTDPGRRPPFNKHDEAHILGGVQFHVAVLRKTHIACHVVNGIVRGLLTGLDPRDTRNAGLQPIVFVSRLTAIAPTVTFDRYAHSYGKARIDGSFSAIVPGRGPGVGVCLYAGSQYSTSAGSLVFQM